MNAKYFAFNFEINTNGAKRKKILRKFSIAIAISVVNFKCVSFDLPFQVRFFSPSFCRRSKHSQNVGLFVQFPYAQPININARKRTTNKNF